MKKKNQPSQHRQQTVRVLETGQIALGEIGFRACARTPSCVSEPRSMGPQQVVGIRQPPGAVRGADRAERRGAGQVPVGLHPPGADQLRLQPRPGPRRSDRLTRLHGKDSHRLRSRSFRAATDCSNATLASAERLTRYTSDLCQDEQNPGPARGPNPEAGALDDSRRCLESKNIADIPLKTVTHHVAMPPGLGLEPSSVPASPGLLQRRIAQRHPG